MIEINNIDITLTKGMLYSENKYLKTYMIGYGLKNSRTVLFTYHIGESSSHKF